MQPDFLEAESSPTAQLQRSHRSDHKNEQMIAVTLPRHARMKRADTN